MGKPELNLKEPDQALMWLKAFEARARVEKKRDIDATPGTSGPQAIAAIANDYQVADLFMSQCGLEALIKLSSLVAPRNIEDVKFIDIRKDLISFLKPQERVVVAERIGFLQMSQEGGENKQKPTTLLGSEKLRVIVSSSISSLQGVTSLKMSGRKSLFPVSQFQVAGLSPMIALSKKSGKCVLFKVLRKSNNFVYWSTSTAG